MTNYVGKLHIDGHEFTVSSSSIRGCWISISDDLSERWDNALNRSDNQTELDRANAKYVPIDEALLEQNWSQTGVVDLDGVLMEVTEDVV